MRRFFAWAFLSGLAVVVIGIDYAYRNTERRDQAFVVIFLAIAAVLLCIPEVRLERGRLTLNGIISVAAAILLNPIDATLVSLLVAFESRKTAWLVLGNALTTATAAVLGSVVSVANGGESAPSLTVRIVVMLVVTAANLAFASVALGVRQWESPLAVLRHNITSSFFIAFAYFGLAGILLSYVLDGSPIGYFLGTIVFVLALALIDTIAGRRVRHVLESELSDADRHLFHSRAVEGVVHNLRNHMATALAYLKEIDTRRLDGADRESLETATAAANDAVAVLRDLAQGATPKVTYAPNPVDLNDLVTRAVGMARPRARGKDVQLAVHEAPADVSVRADPLLMREVMTNLVNNAIDAVAIGGRVEISTGRRNNGWPFVSVADNGPGVPDDRRHHLFEPHFTTKEGGTGLGLFMSYGIVREHQGDLLFSNNRPHGAVFTMVLPPFDDRSS
ncbi:MAG TPA: HAMP domain-containing sensor histidine kinase [Candidatus Dormibacteraeota bacterium]|nr:HAMP domain-containing sensor histidine kinase [Candidatus Dormibacteraeota bacterium]